MKTYEIKMSRSRWTSALIAVMLIVMLVMLCTPYFTYGTKALTFVPQEDGNTAHLQNTWVLGGSDPSQDGYQEIEITSAKAMTVRTTNIIRVNQLAADAAVETAKESYATIAKAVAEAEAYYLKAQKQVEYVKEAAEIAKSATAPEGVDVTTVQTNVDNATNAIATAKAQYDNALACLAKAQDEVNRAREAAVKAYTADASYAWITETEEAYAKAIADAYADKEEGYVDTLVGEVRDSVIYDKLAAEKAIAADAAATAAAILKEAEQNVKDSATAQKGAKNALSTSDKELKKARETAKLVVADAVFTEDEIVVETSEVPALAFEAYDNASAEETMMTTTGKVSYKEKNGALAFTFANGKKLETTYSTSFTYNQIKKLSILGYVGFPYNVEDFTTEMEYRLPGFTINSVVLVPILLMVLALVGIVMCILKADKMSAGFVPALFGLVGIFGYLTSDFLRLGDHYALHIVCYVIITLIAALHIYLGVKDKKAQKA